MTSEEATALRDGVWRASRCDNPAAVLTADTAPELRGLLQDDHAGPLRS